MAWFVILTYAWHMGFRALGTIQDRLDRKNAYFHIIAWCTALVLTVAIMALNRIDGNSITGICFVGHTDHLMKGFVLVPVLVAVLIGGYFLCRGIVLSFFLIFILYLYYNIKFLYIFQCFLY